MMMMLLLLMVLSLIVAARRRRLDNKLEERQTLRMQMGMQRERLRIRIRIRIRTTPGRVPEEQRDAVTSCLGAEAPRSIDEGREDELERGEDISADRMAIYYRQKWGFAFTALYGR